MREQTRREVVAMWLWGAEYARRGLGAIEFYAQLDNPRRRLVEDFLAKIDGAADAPSLLTENYWCGCKREARWQRCALHERLDHDEEPPTQREQKARRTIRRHASRKSVRKTEGK